MAVDIPLELDLGPLSWVQEEVVLSLQRARREIQSLQEGSAPVCAAERAAQEIHQTAGAFELVGIEGLAAFAREVERHLLNLTASPTPENAPQVLVAIDRAVRRLSSHLEEVFSGAPCKPTLLMREYHNLNRLRGAEAGPADLFFPDLNRKPPKLADASPPPANMVQSHLMAARRGYELGLLSWLRGDASGLDGMRENVHSIERLYPLPAQRSFWWSVAGLFEALRNDGLASNVGVKQLAARIDLQIRRFVEGSTKISERLRREVLFHLGRSTPVTPGVLEIQKLYDLTRLVPPPGTMADIIDYVSLHPSIDALNAKLAEVRTNWQRFMAGGVEHHVPLVAACETASHVADELKRTNLSALLSIMAEVAPSGELSATQDPLAIEFSSALLFAETTGKNFSSAPTANEADARALAERLRVVSSGMTVTGAPLVTTAMTRKIQERESFRALLTEVREDLGSVESAIDSWVRGQSALDSALIRSKLSQTIGVFQITEQGEAASVLGIVETELGLLKEGKSADDQQSQVAKIAEALSVLGFYVDAKYAQPDVSAVEILAPVLGREPRSESALEPEMPEPRGAIESFEAAAAVEQRALSAVLRLWEANPHDEAIKTSTRSRLLRLRDDAKVMGNAELAARVRDALHALDAPAANPLGSETKITSAGLALAPEIPLPAVSGETQSLLQKSEPERDDALFDIYLEEANDIISALDTDIDKLERLPNDKEGLRSVRRGFHTLKGSGRMVGLNALSEAALDVERHLNTLLQKEVPVSVCELDLLRTARAEFAEWVANIRTNPADAELLDRSKLDRALFDAAGAAVPNASQSQIPAAQKTLVTSGATLSEFSTPLAPIKRNPEDADVRSFSGLSGAGISALDSPSVATLGMSAVAAIAIAGASTAATSTAPKNLGKSDAELKFESLIAPAPGAPVQIPAVPPTSEIPAPSVSDAPATTAAKDMLGIEDFSFLNQAPVLANLPMATLAPTGSNESKVTSLASMSAPVAHRNEGLPPALLAIVTEEAAVHLQSLRDELERLQFDPSATPSEAAIRAAHTLKGMHFSVGLATIGEHAGDLEAALSALAENRAETPLIPLADAVSILSEQCRAIREGSVLDPVMGDTVDASRDALKRVVVKANENAANSITIDERIASNRSEAAGKISNAQERDDWQESDAIAFDAVASHTPRKAEIPPLTPSAALAPVVPAAMVAGAVVAGAAKSPSVQPAAAPTSGSGFSVPEVPSQGSEIFAGIEDDIDQVVLPIFLEEAAELFPQASALVRQWRDAPTNLALANGLKRTMHTLKGSARMAGAMRLGELAHRLESRLTVNDRAVPGSAQLFEALDGDLDNMAWILDRLGRGETNSDLLEMQSSPAVHRAKTPVLSETVPPVLAASPVAPIATPSALETLIAEINPQRKAETVEAVPAAQIEPDFAQTGNAQSAERAMAWLESENANQAQVLRVRAEAIERLADETGEVSISRSRMESELKALRVNLNELTGSVVRLRSQVREIEIQAESQIQSRLTQVQDADSNFDPLEFDRFTRFQELTRSLAEGVNDVATVQQSVVANLDASEAALSAQGRIARSLQNQLHTIRTIAFSSIRERLYRVLRQTAREVGKRANMDIRGGELMIDRSVIERLTPLVEHVLRNALAHGIELPETRAQLGKSETGEILVELKQQGNIAEVTVTDDGRGFNIPAIRDRAIAKGIANSLDVRTDAEWVEFIFQSGFTTADEITSVSGRGVGMDVVRTELAALGGRVEARIVSGRGACFVLNVPLTLTVTNAVLVQIGAHRFGVPGSIVENVKSIKNTERMTARQTGQVLHGRDLIPYVLLNEILNEPADAVVGSTAQCLVVRSGNSTIAIDADAIYGSQEVVLKRTGPQLAKVPGLVGVSLLGDGEILLIYNPVTLMQSASSVAATGLKLSAIPASEMPSARDAASPPAALSDLQPAGLSPAKPISVEDTKLEAVSTLPLGVVVPIRLAQPSPDKPLVLVVDDSLTVRKITTRFLEREGFATHAAKDGLDALTVLSSYNPRVILLDIEMPRMDGFEFTRAIKNDAKLKNIPIIMITSRTADKHRNMALELGVNVYLGKPYQDDELLKNIRALI